MPRPSLGSARRLTAVLQARMQSSRLPGKVLLPVLHQPMLLHNVERLCASRSIDRVVVATSSMPADDAIAECCRAAGIECFRGSETDVLDRMVQCARVYDLDPLLRFTADNPLIDPDVVDHVVAFYFAHADEFDYVSNNHPPTWPDGLEVELVRRATLEESWRLAMEPFQREHCMPFIWDQPERYRIGNVTLAGDNLHAERWTLDYPADYELIRRIFEELYPVKPDFRMADVLDLLARQPELRRINEQHVGITWYGEHAGALRTIATD